MKFFNGHNWNLAQKSFRQPFSMFLALVFGGIANSAAAENVINLATGLLNKSGTVITRNDPYWDVNNNNNPAVFQDALSVFPGDPD